MTDPAASPARTDVPTRSRKVAPLDVLRGFLIGMAELVPGVSGGTVALVTGVYEQLIASASHVVGAARMLVTGPDRLRSAREELRRTDWWLIVPVLVGMGLAVVTMAGVMTSFVGGHPELARGLFLGLVAASIAVPVRMLPPGTRPLAVDLVVVAAAVALAWLLIGLAAGGGSLDAAPPVVFLVAAIAVCALVVPGVSGSFFLLAVGLYTVTLAAVDERDLGYIAVFALGAVAGLASFVQLLRWLLVRHRRTTLLVMTGLMIGSLRALWPWQSGGDEEVDGPGSLVAPYAPVLGPVLLALLGVAVVGVLVAVEIRSERRAAERSDTH
ncbi:DUF368 domain-containing protein [Phycicoccus sp. BSK3Z-2]|uniref:DUF368 domain-containing protein n=1 Tax=Phycicoccus avicenniae TaxID=2828860 RepID=A0A941DEF7_9MICO|nr:DUF368 domain-containing protein [Phycicoccus avicenniae]MBR7744807.1 DUF368 domain-containing protein [Phycicoccus avicenniae]